MRQKTRAELLAANERLARSEGALQEYFLATVRKAPVTVIEVGANNPAWRVHCTALHRYCGGVAWIDYGDWQEPPVFLSELAARWANEPNYAMRDASLAMRELMQRSCDESTAMDALLRAICARKAA